MKKSSIVAGLTAVLLFAAATPSTAQYYAFGKNKVQYESFQWLTLKGEHVEVFYYPEEEPIARIALVLAEESYKDLAAKFQHEVPKTVPMIVYSTHHHFEQTNVSPGFLPEGVQGFTEFLKGRVVLPYTGSYAEFHHVIHHEMVHVFQFSIMDEVYKAHRRASYVVPPLWFSEGLAEYWSTPWDAQGTMVMSDMVLEGHLPTIDDMWKYNGTFTIYKMGQSLCEYIGTTYGDDALRRLYTDIYREDNFEKLIQRVTGVSARHLSEDWILAQKRRYFPQVKDRSALSLAAQPRAVSEGINLKPVAAPDTSLLGGYRYFFISARDGYTNIYSATYKGAERQVKPMVRGQRNPQFESFHPFQSRIDISIKGELAFVSKWEGRDALFIMDAKSKKILVRQHIPKLIAISSPAWSPDGSKVVFSGLEASGQGDLYLMERDSETLTRLTNDFYADSDPTWSPDGSQIAFASDRTRYGKDGHQNLFILDMDDARDPLSHVRPLDRFRAQVVADGRADRVHVGPRRHARDLHGRSRGEGRAHDAPPEQRAGSVVAPGREECAPDRLQPKLLRHLPDGDEHGGPRGFVLARPGAHRGAGALDVGRDELAVHRGAGRLQAALRARPRAGRDLGVRIGERGAGLPGGVQRPPRQQGLLLPDRKQCEYRVGNLFTHELLGLEDQPRAPLELRGRGLPHGG
jgi:hypothetical protein